MTVRLRPLAAADCDIVREWRNRPHVAAMMYTDHEISAGEHAQWFACALTDQTKRYFIIETLEEAGWTGAGLAGFTQMNGESASWGFYLADPETRGTGVGARAQFLALCKAFDEFNLQTLRCEVFAFNTRALGLYESFGFARTGMIAVKKGGEAQDVICLEVGRADWPFLRGIAGHRLNLRTPRAANSA
jgi:UDP-4-amino-4,6-dideoxy-N-acetyl-beta-L-altrosamine N-acetyltransferase